MRSCAFTLEENLLAHVDANAHATVSLCACASICAHVRDSPCERGGIRVFRIRAETPKKTVVGTPCYCKWCAVNENAKRCRPVDKCSICRRGFLTRSTNGSTVVTKTNAHEQRVYTFVVDLPRASLSCSPNSNLSEREVTSMPQM